MRTIIAGSRTCTDPLELSSALKSCGWVPTVVLSDTAKGADRLGELWAERNNVPCEKYPANWRLFGKSAGYRRNLQMSDNAEALIALWDRKSKRTKNMIDIAKRKGLKVYVHYIKALSAIRYHHNQERKSLENCPLCDSGIPVRPIKG